MGRYYYRGSWETLVSEWGYEIIDSRFCGDYHGDYVALLDDGLRLGLAVVGYGSCSGCDALQACESPEEVAGLSEGVRSDVRWFATPAEFAAYVEDRTDTGTDWYWYEREINEFLVELAGRFR